VNAHKAVLIYSSLLFLRCDVAHRPAAPSIEFTKLPPFGAGSSSKLEAIEGRATGVRAGQKIVLYARSGQWWVQPLADHPFTAVQADFSWRNKTHPGSAYAALLVTDGYRPGITIETLPEKGGAVLAVVATENSGVVGTGEKTLTSPEAAETITIRQTPGWIARIIFTCALPAGRANGRVPK
jgi:hypothetical protein